MIDKVIAAGGDINPPPSSFTWDRFTTLIDPNSFAGQSAGVIFAKAIGLLLMIASVVAFVYLVIAGIKYITAGGDATKAGEARGGIINALIGIIVIALSWVIINFALGLFSQ